MKRILFSIVCISIVSVCFAGSTETDKNAKLIQAAKDGNLQSVKNALSEGADINTKDKNGVPVLMWASRMGHTEVVKLLLEKGADVNVKKTTDGVTALLMASAKSHTEVVKLLIAAKADVNAKATVDGKDYTPLSVAKNKEIKELLEKSGAKYISQVQVTKEKVDSEINDEIFEYGKIIIEFVHANLEKYEGGKIFVSKEFPLRVKCGENLTVKKREYPFEYQNIKGVLEIGDMQAILPMYEVNYKESGIGPGDLIDFTKLVRRIKSGLFTFYGAIQCSEKEIVLIGEITKTNDLEISFSSGMTCRINSMLYQYNNDIWMPIVVNDVEEN